MTVNRLSIDREGMQLLPENSFYRPSPITPEQHLMIWGVVTRVIAKSIKTTLLFENKEH